MIQGSDPDLPAAQAGALYLGILLPHVLQGSVLISFIVYLIVSEVFV